MRKLKIGIVGVGGIGGDVHLPAYLRNPNVEVIALCDLNEERLQTVGQRHGITRLYTDEAKMLEEVPELDAVSVCTWNAAHAPCSIMALNAGKHVLCEKPMAMNAKEAEEMKAAADRNGKILMIGFVLRYAQETLAVEDLIKDGFFGDFYYAKAIYLRRNGFPGRWFGTKALSGGGPLIDLGVHVIDRTRFLMGNPQPVSVYGATFNKLGPRKGIKGSASDIGYEYAKGEDVTFDVEDLVTAMIRYDNGAVVEVEASFTLNTASDAPCAIEMFGDKGGMKVGSTLELYSTTGSYMNDMQLKLKDPAQDDLFGAEINHFADCILNGTPCKSPAEDGVTIMKILDAIYESAQTGHEVIL